jgi:hypothetical protein
MILGVCYDFVPFLVRKREIEKLSGGIVYHATNEFLVRYIGRGAELLLVKVLNDERSPCRYA